MPWQQLVLDTALEVNPETGRLAYREVRLTVPRQSGKTTLILAKNVHRMARAAAFGGRQRLTYTAQTRKKALEKLLDDYVEELKQAKALRGRWRLSLRSGAESVRWNNGSIWGIESNTEKAGHGSTLDVADIDEAFAQIDSRAEQAHKPAMITRPQPQLWVVSTAGTDASAYLRAKVTSGREIAEAGLDTGVAYFEWCAEEDADPESPETWRTCMPALGHTVTEDAVRADFLSMEAADFQRAYLNWWVDRSTTEYVIPLLEWGRCAESGSRISGAKVFALDVSPNGSTASIAVAGMRSDGRPHIELVTTGEGTGWVVERIVRLTRDHQVRRIKIGEKTHRTGVLLDPTSPASELLAKLRARGIDPYQMSARDVGAACGGLRTDVRDRGVVHTGQQQVLDALKGAAKRPLGDGGWAYARRVSSVDISPIVAVTFALHGLRMAESTPAASPLVATA